jgi:hypothetical protein
MPHIRRSAPERNTRPKKDREVIRQEAEPAVIKIKKGCLTGTRSFGDHSSIAPVAIAVAARPAQPGALRDFTRLPFGERSKFGTDRVTQSLDFEDRGDRTSQQMIEVEFVTFWAAVCERSGGGMNARKRDPVGFGVERRTEVRLASLDKQKRTAGRGPSGSGAIA